MDAREKCLERGVPEAMVNELLANDRTLNRFFDSHDILGEPRDGEG